MNAEKIKELRGLIAQWRATNCRTEAQDRVYRVCADQLEPLLAALLDELEALKTKLAELVDAASDVRPYCADIEGVRQIARLRAAIDAARHEPKDAEHDR
jgi:hypothetical protein